MSDHSTSRGFTPATGQYRGMRIGLLGGSFNPAHDGHLHVSRQALRRLGLDHVWWLVSPQNPLKPRQGMAPLSARLESAARLASHDPRIRATDLETRLGTRYTTDTLRALKHRYPGARFVWLMGADNLADLHRWYRWRTLMRLVPVAVFDRPGYARKALTGKAACCFLRHRLPEDRSRALATDTPPAWVFLHGRLSEESATAIRQQLGDWAAERTQGDDGDRYADAMVKR